MNACVEPQLTFFYCCCYFSLSFQVCSPTKIKAFFSAGVTLSSADFISALHSEMADSISSPIQELAATHSAHPTPLFPENEGVNSTDVNQVPHNAHKTPVGTSLWKDSESAFPQVSSSAGQSQFQSTTQDSDDDDDDSSVQSHTDSFYASLAVAQQLRLQRGATKVVNNSHSSSSARTFASKATSRNVSVDFSPLSPRLRVSRKTPVVSGVNAASFSLSQPPCTLQDLLVWRQEMLEAQIHEQRKRQRQRRHHWQDNNDDDNNSLSSSPSLSTSGYESSQQSARGTAAVFTPQVYPLRALSLGSHQASPHMLSVTSPVTAKESTLTPDQLFTKTETHSAGKASAHSLHLAPSSPIRAANRPCVHLLPLAEPPNKAPSAAGSPGRSSHSTPLRLDSTPNSVAMEQVSAYVCLHDNDIGQWVPACLAFFLLTVFVFVFIFDASFFPGGMWWGLFEGVLFCC